MDIYTKEQITEMADTWRNYHGFSGETCGKCHKTANVFAFSLGWICDCGHFNLQAWSLAQVPHEQPDMGTPRAVIVEGNRASKKYQAYLRPAQN
jgi:hypothetical protein